VVCRQFHWLKHERWGNLDTKVTTNSKRFPCFFFLGSFLSSRSPFPGTPSFVSQFHITMAQTFLIGLALVSLSGVALPSAAFGVKERVVARNSYEVTPPREGLPSVSP
jgi:hypothetical protein